MSDFDPLGEPPLESSTGGFTYGVWWASSQTRFAKLEIFADRLVVGPRSRSKLGGILAPRWTARYADLEPVWVVKRPTFLGIGFRRKDGRVFTFRPAGGPLDDRAEPILAALRRLGVPIAG
jgi:hypothetical protein